MATNRSKLRKDLTILLAMAAEIDDYLINDALFRQLGPGLPKLTLGGFLLRQHRLQTLANSQLTGDEKQHLSQASATFEAVSGKRSTQFRQKRNQELEARQRQWQGYLDDLKREREASELNAYRTAAEIRTMISHLMEAARLDSTGSDHDLAQQVAQQDQSLRASWLNGQFIWEAAWEAAYPKEKFWWLYGKPKP